MDHGSTIAQIFLGNLRIEDLVKKAVEDKIAKLVIKNKSLLVKK